MNKFSVAFLIIGFWLFLPIPMGYLGVGGYDYVKDTDLTVADNTTEITLVNFIGEMWNLFKVYFNLLFFTIPNAPSLVNYFLLFLKSATIFLAIVMFRGN